MKLRYVMLILLLLALTAAMACMRPYGSPAEAAMDEYFILNGQAETGSNNIVTAVVFDYRGMDTLIEASILFAAATGVVLMLYGRKDDE